MIDALTGQRLCRRCGGIGLVMADDIPPCPQCVGTGIEIPPAPAIAPDIALAMEGRRAVVPFAVMELAAALAAAAGIAVWAWGYML